MSAQETVRETGPLIIAKTSIESQRSSGYRGTHSAVNEFVDNSIEAGRRRFSSSPRRVVLSRP